MSTENRHIEFADQIIVNVYCVSLMFVYFTIYKRKRTDRLHTTELFKIWISIQRGTCMLVSANIFLFITSIGVLATLTC